MTSTHASAAARIRTRLSHPVIDSDGHRVEFEPAALDYLRQVGGERIVERYKGTANQFGNKKRARMTPEERRESRMMQPVWWAFNRQVNPFGARLGAIFGSDIGHFDVPNMTEVLGEAYEGVEDGWLAEEDFHDFVFGNPVRLWAGMNPNFFKGTAVESQVQKFLGETGGGAADTRTTK
ncbi:MAG: hypothetical protein ACRERD_07020 [Candidatus Binatia bacterium]